MINKEEIIEWLIYVMRQEEINLFIDQENTNG